MTDPTSTRSGLAGRGSGRSQRSPQDHERPDPRPANPDLSQGRKEGDAALALRTWRLCALAVNPLRRAAGPERPWRSKWHLAVPGGLAMVSRLNERGRGPRPAGPDRGPAPSP